MRPSFSTAQEFGSVPFQNVIFSMVVFFVMYPLGVCKSHSSNNVANTTASGNITAQMLKKFKDIINLKARTNALIECNTSKVKLLAELIKRYRRVLRNMSNNGVKRTSKIPRMKDLVREKKVIGISTTSSTNQRKKRISFKNGQFLSVDQSGRVYGTLGQAANNNNNTIFYVKTITSQIVMIQSFHTQEFVVIDKHGHVCAKATPDDDALFYLRSEENNFLTLASYKYYLLCPYDMFLAIRNSGYIRSPHQSLPGQDSTQIMFV